MAQKKVLIIDSDIASRGFLSRTLEQKQCAVFETSLGKEGLVLAWRDHPDLILVDPVLSDLSGEDVIRRLRGDPRSADIFAIALSRDPNPERKYACLGAGFNEYLHKSPEAIPILLQKFDSLLTDKAESPPEKANNGGLLVVFLSSKGGTGTSSLCANLAMNIGTQEKDSRVVIVDSILPIGSIAQIVGYDGVINLATVSGMPPQQTDSSYLLKNLPALPAWHVHLLAGSPDPQSAVSLRADRIKDIIGALKAVYDFVLIDFGRALSQISLPVIQQADMIVLVVGNDLSTVALTKIVWQYLRLQGVEAKKIFPILNRAVGLEGLTKPEIENMLGLEIKATMPYLGGNFAMANNQHVPFTVKFPRDTASMILQEAAKQIVGLARRVRTGMQEGVHDVV